MQTATALPQKLPAVLFDGILLGYHQSGLGIFIIQIELDFDCRLDVHRLRRAFEIVLDAEPILGCRIVPDPRRPFWVRLSPGERGNFFVARDETFYAEFLMAPLDPCVEPQIKACLWQKTGGDRLLIKFSHVAGDTGAAKEATARIAAIYRALADDPACHPEPNLAGCRDFSQVLHHVPWYAYPRIVMNFLRQTWKSAVPPRSLCLTFPPGPRTPAVYIMRALSPERTRELAYYGRARGATLNDMIVAALYRALASVEGWDGRKRLRMQTTIDLRRWYIDGGKAAGICNLSLYEYPHLGRRLGDTFDETLALVSRATSHRKKDWPGLTDICLGPLLKLMSHDRMLRTMLRASRRFLEEGNTMPALTNLGPIDRAAVTFDRPPVRAHALPPIVFPPLIGLGISGYDGGLTLSAGLPASAASRAEAVLDALLFELPHRA